MLGFVQLAERGANDLFLGALASSLKAAGWRLAGAVQVNGASDARGVCDMDLTLLPDGPTISISQCLGVHSSGCRLDTAALEEAVAVSAGRLPRAEVLIVNKFGKHEAEGRGFRTLIAEAMGAGVPVVVGVNRQNRQAFEAFAGDLATELSADPDRIADWLGSRAHALPRAV